MTPFPNLQLMSLTVTCMKNTALVQTINYFNFRICKVTHAIPTDECPVCVTSLLAFKTLELRQTRRN